MAIALVGSRGAASQGAAGAAVTPAWGTNENRAAGNLLICTVTVTAVATLPTTPSGWSIAAQVAGTSCSSTVYYKIAAGSDAAPTIAAITSGVIAAQLSEYSGADPSGPLDEFGTQTGTSSPITETLPGPDQATGELLIAAGADRRSVARATNDTWTSNSGTPTLAGSNNGTSSQNHYSFAALVGTNQNAVADTAVMTLSITTSITGLAVAAASFRERLAKSASDSGTGTDAVSTVNAALSSSDSGTATEGATVDTGPVAKSGSDSGTATDAVQGIGISGPSESGTATEAVSRIGIAASDSGAGTDTASPPAAALSASESGSGSDLVSSVSLPGHGDAAAGQETASLAASLSGSGEGGTASEVASLAVQAGASESGVATETATVTVQVSASESGSGTDLASPPSVQVAASESGTGTEVASVQGGSTPKAGDESGTSTETATTSAALAASEAGTGAEQSSLSVQVSPASESGMATESATVTVRIDATEAGTGLEAFGDLLALLQGSDEAIAVEIAAVRTGTLVPRPGIRTSEGGTAATTIADEGPQGAAFSEGPRHGGSPSDGPRSGGQASDRPNITVGVTDG